MTKTKVLLAMLTIPAAIISQQQSTPSVPRAPDHYNNGLLEISVAHGEPNLRERKEMEANGRLWHGARLAITIKNVSDENVLVAQTSVAQYEFEVFNSAGVPVPLTPAGERARATRRTHLRNPTSAYSAMLQPGEKVTEVLDISRFFQIFPGEAYTVRVRRSDGLPDHRRNGEKIEPELSTTFAITGHEDQ